MRTAIVTDAWKPQVNGVAVTYENLGRQLEFMGDEVRSIAPDEFRTMPCPSYPTIKLAMFPRLKVAKKLIEAFLQLDLPGSTDYVKQYSWAACAETFRNHLARIPDDMCDAA